MKPLASSKKLPPGAARELARCLKSPQMHVGRRAQQQRRLIVIGCLTIIKDSIGVSFCTITPFGRRVHEIFGEGRKLDSQES